MVADRVNRTPGADNTGRLETTSF